MQELRAVAYKPGSPSERKVIDTIGSHTVWQALVEAQTSAQHQICWIVTADQETRRLAAEQGKAATDDLHDVYTHQIVQNAIERRMQRLTQRQIDAIGAEFSRRWLDLFHKVPVYALQAGDTYRRIHARTFATAIAECRAQGMEVYNIREEVEEAVVAARWQWRLARIEQLREERSRGGMRK